MKINFLSLAPKTAVLVLIVSLFSFCTTAIQALRAHRLATHTVEVYEPKIDKEAVAIIISALPNTEKGAQAAFLARGLAENVEGQYKALFRAVQSQASALTYQLLGWGCLSVIAIFGVFESRRQVL